MNPSLSFTLFEQLLPSDGDPQLAKACHTFLLSHYAQPDRAYHNLEHIADVMAQTAPFHATLCVEDWGCLQLAIWFHDVVYDTRATDNEARSAAAASEWLSKLGCSPTMCRTVETLILATQHHTPQSELAEIIVDADLAILGQSSATYQEYAAKIRQEYSWVPEEAYRAGRSKVLRGFLERPQIYFTSDFAALENQARHNLQAELTSLNR